MHSIKDLKNQIKSLIKISDTNIFEYTKKETLKSKLKRLNEIEEILKIKKYKIVFIGTVGAGKTTAISHLFNLTTKITKSIKRGRRTKDIDVIVPLLSTGSGRTTICEVEVKSNQDTFIEIDPYRKDELKKEIKEFCKSIYGKSTENNIISIELERAIRAIIGLKEITKQHTDEDGKKHIEKIDLAKNKAKEFNSLEEFEEYALINANLNDRVYTLDESKISFTDDIDMDEKTWIKNNFSKINRAEISNFSIPKRINVYINKSIFGDSNLDIFDSVIDTKGIDENPIREDLTNYIQDKNTICIFTSSYNDAPETNIRELLQHTLAKESKNYQERFITLVMPKNNEPENENDADGSWENGIAIKKDIVKKIFNNLKLNFHDNNIMFYDALEFYDSEGSIDSDEEYIQETKEDIQKTKTKLINNIHNVIKEKEKNLKHEIKEIRDSVAKLKEGQSLSIEEEKHINNLVEKLKSIKDLNKKIPSSNYESFIKKYINYYSTLYKAWNTKDAIHRRHGVFPARGFSTYYDAEVIAEGLNKDDMLQKFTKELKEEVEISLDNICNEISQLSDMIPEIKNVFNSEYDNFIHNVGQGLREFLEKENKNKYFWQELIERRGKGRGYNDDVTKMFYNKLMSFQHGLDINGVFQDISEKEWEILIDKILIFFQKV